MGALRPFVGRHAELEQLRAAFAQAAMGEGRCVMLAGEPGVGKTTLCEHFATYVTGQGGTTLTGHCYAAGSLSVPYLPFVEAIRAHAVRRDPKELQARISGDAAEVARIVPEIREMLQLEMSEDSGFSGEEKRYRLVQGVTSFIRGIATPAPLVLVLEDLHDADRGTLDLLTNLLRNLDASRLLVLGTYRDTEVDRVHPLSTTLAELRRSSAFHRIALHGLQLPDVHELLDRFAVAGVDDELVERVYRQTEGNALFVLEVARYLASEGSSRARGSPAVDQIPEGLRDVLGKHLSRLSSVANDVLRVAAVIGRDFRLDVLTQVLAVPEDEVVTSLEQACAAALLEEQVSPPRTAAYQFRHLLFRQTLYEEISAPRRIRWHKRVATVLEQVHAHTLDEHAAELAEHFSHSSDLEDLAKAMAYSELAAARASRVYAYTEAAHHLERALDLQDLADPNDGAKRCDLLLGLAAAFILAGHGRRVAEEVAPAAYQLAMVLADTHRAFRACTFALDGLQSLGGIAADTLPNWLEWAERASTCAEPDTLERVRADIALAAARSVRGQPTEAITLWHHALSTARARGDATAFIEAGYRWLCWPTAEEWPDHVALVREMSSAPHEGVSNRLVGNALNRCAVVMLAEGDRQRFEEVTTVANAAYTRGYRIGAEVVGRRRQSILCLLDGRLEEAIEISQMSVDRTATGGPRVLGLFAAMWHMRLPLAYLGRHDRYVEVVRAYQAAAGVPREESGLMLALGLARAGRSDEARVTAGRLIDGPMQHRFLNGLLLRLELAVLWEDLPAVRVLMQLLEPVVHLGISDGCSAPVARLVGNACMLLDDFDTARRRYELAIERCQLIRYRPELALSRLDLAELLLDHFPEERGVALGHLQGAVSEFEAMHMRPALDRASARLEAARANSAGATLPHDGDALTLREREVAALLGSGMSNREIAEDLTISEGTAEVHVKHILSKLGFRSRAQVAVWAAEHGLTSPSS